MEANCRPSLIAGLIGNDPGVRNRGSSKENNHNKQTFTNGGGNLLRSFSPPSFPAGHFRFRLMWEELLQETERPWMRDHRDRRWAASKVRLPTDPKKIRDAKCNSIRLRTAMAPTQKAKKENNLATNLWHWQGNWH